MILRMVGMTTISLNGDQDCTNRFGFQRETTTEVQKLYQKMALYVFQEIHTRTQLFGEDASSFSSSV